MEKITVKVPTMYGDHHVLTVRDAVSAVAGVGEINASAKAKEVTVSFDAGKTSADKIKGAIEAAGYAIEKDLELAQVANSSPGFANSDKAASADPRDKQFSGDFRKY